MIRSAHRRAPGPGLLIALYAALAAAPLMIAAVSGARERDFLPELAVAAGLVALAMLLLQFVSSGRYEWLSGRVGIDRTMRFHQLLAFSLFILAVLHPVLLALPQNLRDLGRFPAGLVTMAGAEPLRSGVIALVLLAGLVVLGILRSRLALRYEIWRGAHVIMAHVVAAAAVHHALAVGLYSGAGAMKGFWMLLTAMTVCTFGYVYVVKPLLLSRSAYRVKSNRAVGPDIRELVLEPTRGHALSYVAGQFIWIGFGRWPNPLADHPYSLASSPREGDELKLMIKARGDFSAAAGSIATGTPAYVDGPHGDFILDQHRLGDDKAGNIALIAGGIGIAPIVGILRDLELSGDRRRIGLLYGVRNAERLAGREVIETAAQTLDLQAEYVLEEPPPDWQGRTGAMTPDLILGALRGADPWRCLCMLCGPTPMMLAAEKVLLGAGVPAGNIVYERFEYA